MSKINRYKEGYEEEKIFSDNNDSYDSDLRENRGSAVDTDTEPVRKPYFDPDRNPLLDPERDSVLTDDEYEDYEDRQNKRDKNIIKLNKLIRDQKIAIVATKCDDHGIVSRPMYTVDKDFDGTLWFFTTEGSTVAKQVEANKLVNVTFFYNDYVALSGTGEIIVDTQKNRELWSPVIEDYLEVTPENNKVRLIKFTPEYAEYWDEKNKLAQAFNMLKAKITDERPDVGEHEKINI